ncbi:MAG TPA: cytochrome c [Rhizomicrobium sp.]|nr:cytochrome c [Rhizomicrobium sp.]
MSMRKLAAAICVFSLSAVPALAADAPHFGVPAAPARIKAWDISILSDGTNLPPGKGSVSEGAQIYSEKCQSCHGANGEGKPADRLTGGVGSLKSPQPVKTVASYWPYATTLFDYIRRAMPVTHPRSLSDHEAYALTAYILSIDGIVKKNAVLDAKSLPKVQMPNRDGFIDTQGVAPR